MDSNLCFDILPKRQRELFEVLSKETWIKKFYLAGGTALALQLGHRKSVDLDFFIPEAFDVLYLKNKLKRVGDFKLYSENEDTIHGEINSVEISFFNIPYHLIDDAIAYRNIRIACKKDIAAMKLAAISSRGSKKDFVDMFFLLKEFSLDQMLGFYKEKYGESEENIYCTLKGLVYFEDANEEKMPKMFIEVPWREIKKQILHAHAKYLKGLKS